MCTGACGFKKTFPKIFSDDIYSESGCPVHSCTTCHAIRIAEQYGKE